MSEFKPLDPTACGLFLVAVVSLPLAIANLTEDPIYAPTPEFFMGIGAMILVVALLAYRAESQFGFTVFALVGTAVFLTGYGGMYTMMDIAFALTYFLAIIWSLWIKTPKALTVICFTTMLVFLTVGLSGIIDGDYWPKVIGIVALLNFLANIYLSFALASDGKVKVI